MGYQCQKMLCGILTKVIIHYDTLKVFIKNTLVYQNIMSEAFMFILTSLCARRRKSQFLKYILYFLVFCHYIYLNRFDK